MLSRALKYFRITKHKTQVTCFKNRKQLTFRDTTTGFTAKWQLRNERRNWIEMSECHYKELHCGAISHPTTHQHEVGPKNVFSTHLGFGYRMIDSFSYSICGLSQSLAQQWVGIDAPLESSNYGRRKPFFTNFNRIRIGVNNCRY